MRKHGFSFSYILTLSLFLLFTSSSLYAADFNIKLRKTDINELKQQLMPAFEQSIQYLNGLLNCLEQGKPVDTCIDEYSVVLDDKKEAETKERREQIKQSIRKKIKDGNIQREEIVIELKKLLLEAEKVKQCLDKGQSANDLKDCIK